MSALYIHIPFCKQKCLYCDFNSSSCLDYVDDYKNSLINEIDMYKNKYNNLKINTIFIGGGTPSLMSAEFITSVLDAIKQAFCLSNNCEISIESNPESLTYEKAIAYKSAGINRISIGLQAWQDNLLKALGRVHDKNTFIKAYNAVIKAGFDNINVDLMYGLPNQTLADWEETLINITKLSINHISAYSLKIEEGTPFYKMYDENKIMLPNEELERDMNSLAIDVLSNNGYKWYETSNFAKSGYECKHNLTYWQNGEYIGLGCSAWGRIGNVRYSNFYDIKEYINSISNNQLPVDNKENISKETDMFDTIMLGLRLVDGIDIREFNTKYNVDFLVKYNGVLKQLIDDDLILLSDDSIKLTRKGFDLQNYVLGLFL